jgi:DNA-binding winged helix-turn-helix (wHTH) protein
VPTVPSTYQFGPFRLDVAERRLLRDGEPIPLRLKVFDTLCVLVENAGRLVTKEDLLQAIWPDTAVEENNLNHNVSILRKVLGEKAVGQAFIETVPRVGYRFVAEVEAAPSSHARDERPRDTARQEIRYCTTASGWRTRRAATGLRSSRRRTGSRTSTSSGRARSGATGGKRCRSITESYATTSAATGCRSATSPM